jgi:hypothetical protein
MKDTTSQLVTNPISSRRNAITDGVTRLYVKQKVTAGPAAIKDRELELVLTCDEAFNLGLLLISSLPMNWLETQDITRLRKIVAMIDTNKPESAHA